MEDTLDFGHEEIAFGKEGADLQFIGCRPAPQDAAGEIDGGEGQVCQQRRIDVDLPSPGLHFGYASDDEVADLGRVPGTEGGDGEEFVGAEEGAGYGGGDCGRSIAGVKGAVASCEKDY